MTQKIKAYISIAIGLFFCGTVLIGYIPIPEYAIELTCISNTCIGVLLILTGIHLLKGKEVIPSIAYHMGVVTILLVCLVSCVGQFNFKGAFFFLHLVNPIAFLIYYVCLVDDTKKRKTILLTPLPVLLYLSFDYVLGMVRGRFVYGIFEVSEVNAVVIVITVVGVYFILFVIAIMTQILNRIVKIKRIQTN